MAEIREVPADGPAPPHPRPGEANPGAGKPPVTSRRRRGLLLAAVVGIGLALPTLEMGFMMDDYAQLALVESWHPKNAGTFNLYSFLDELPIDPWWKHPELAVSMWRPLPSALLHLDHRLFGHRAVGYHLHSILWFAALLAACGLLFAVDECHLLNVGWIANRHAMVTMVPALLGLLAHLRWREDGWRPGLPLSIAGWAVGLAGGEVALAVIGYAVAYELFAPPAATRRLAGVVPAGLLPVGALGVGYVAVYKLAGFGAAHSGFYLDPTGDPAAFLLGAAGHLPAFFAAALAGLPSDLWFFVPALRPLQVAAGVLALMAFAWLLRRLWPGLGEAERRALRWLLPGALFALLPAAMTQPFDRVLIAPMVGVAALIGVVLAALLDRWRAGSRRLAGVLALALLAVHLLLPAVGRLAGQHFMARQWRGLARMAERIPIDPASAARRDVVVLTAPDIIVAGFFPLMRAFHGQPPTRSWSVLSLAPHDHRLTRTGARTLELRIPEGRMLTSPAERFHRSAGDPLERGDRVRDELFEVEVLADDGRGPTRVAFRFDRPLDDPGLLFLGWTEDGLRPVTLPPRGETLELPRAPGSIAVALRELGRERRRGEG